MKSLIKRSPVFSFYILVFAISWGGILILIGGPGQIPGSQEQAERLFIPALLIMFSGPFISGIAMNLFIDGKYGVRNLFLRIIRWKAAWQWYVVAVMTGPVLVASILLGLSFINQEFLPGIITAKDKLSAVFFGVAWGLVGGGLFEETGWTGFAVPQLRKKYGMIATGLIVGILWGTWHFMIAFWASNYLAPPGSWRMFVSGFIAFYLLALPAYRILLVWVYDRTGSLPVVMVMHAFLSASTLILQPSSSGEIALVWNLVLGIILWLIVATIMVIKRVYFSRSQHKNALSGGDS